MRGFPQPPVGGTGSTDAADITITDAGGYFTATDVEGALQEVMASPPSPDADDVPITDAGGYFTATDVEGALQELGAASGGGGGFLSHAYAEIVGSASTAGATAIPYDNTAPLITEGDPLAGFNVSHAATNAASKLRVTLTLPTVASSSSGTTGITLWRGSTLVGSAFIALGAAGTTKSVVITRTIDAGDTASHNWTVRAGGNVVATIYVGWDSGVDWGDTIISNLEIFEF